MKYTFTDFKKDFPNDDVCLDLIFKRKFKSLSHYKRVSGRRAYFDPKTSDQIYPTANTIFHGTRTSLTDWFYSMFLIAQSKNGVSSMELQRQIGVTYKTAWRINQKIRELMKQEDLLFDGTVELDETYFGGKEKNKHQSKRIRYCNGRSVAKKIPIFGLLERQGKLVASVVPDVKQKTLNKYINKHIKKDSKIMTDEYNGYNQLHKKYKHKIVNHAKKEYVNGDTHTNNLEGFWGQFKRSTDGTHHVISPKWLQSYLNEYVFKYNQRNSGVHLFFLLLEKI